MVSGVLGKRARELRATGLAMRQHRCAPRQLLSQQGRQSPVRLVAPALDQQRAAGERGVDCCRADWIWMDE